MCEKMPTAVIKSKRDREKGHRMSAGREIRPKIIKNSEESIMNEKCGIDVMLRDGKADTISRWSRNMISSKFDWRFHFPDVSFGLNFLSFFQSFLLKTFLFNNPDVF